MQKRLLVFDMHKCKEGKSLTCFIASTIVTVFPVPGGPNTIYGAPLMPPESIWLTFNEKKRSYEETFTHYL